MKRNIIIGVILIIGIVLIFSFGNFGKNKSQNINFEASSDKDSYSSGEQISLSVNLTNLAKEDVCLNKYAIGNISLKSLTRDGNDVETRSAPSYFLTSFSEILKSRLISVSPGEVVEFDLTSSFDPGLKAEALSTTIAEDSSGMATFYNVETPGLYELELVYEYIAGPSDNCLDIFEGPSKSAIITFKVE